MRFFAILPFLTALAAAPLAAQAQPLPRMSAFDTHLASGKAAVQQSRYLEADRQLRLAIGDSETLAETDPERPGHLAEASETLCDLDLLIGKYDEAVALEERATSTLEKALGSDSHDLVPHLIRLAG